MCLELLSMLNNKFVTLLTVMRYLSVIASDFDAIVRSKLDIEYMSAYEGAEADILIYLLVRHLIAK